MLSRLLLTCLALLTGLSVSGTNAEARGERLCALEAAQSLVELEAGDALAAQPFSQTKTERVGDDVALQSRMGLAPHPTALSVLTGIDRSRE